MSNIAYVTIGNVDSSSGANVDFAFLALAPDDSLVQTVGGANGGGGSVPLAYGDSGEDIKTKITVFLQASNVYNDSTLKVRFVDG